MKEVYILEASSAGDATCIIEIFDHFPTFEEVRNCIFCEYETFSDEPMSTDDITEEEYNELVQKFAEDPEDPENAIIEVGQGYLRWFYNSNVIGISKHRVISQEA